MESGASSNTFIVKFLTPKYPYYKEIKNFIIILKKLINKIHMDTDETNREQKL